AGPPAAVDRGASQAFAPPARPRAIEQHAVLGDGHRQGDGADAGGGSRAARVKVAVTVTGELPAMTQGSGGGWLTASRHHGRPRGTRTPDRHWGTGSAVGARHPSTILGRSRCPFLLHYLARPPTGERGRPVSTTSDRPPIAKLRAGWVEWRHQCRGRRAPPTIGRTSPAAAARATPHLGSSWLPALPPSRSSGFSPLSTSPRPGSGCPWRPCTRASPWCGRRRESRWPPC